MEIVNVVLNGVKTPHSYITGASTFGLPSSGSISLSQVNAELGRTLTASINMNDGSVRSLAGKSSGVIALSDLRGKRHRGSYYLFGEATTRKRATSHDAGTTTQSWYNIPRSSRIRARVWATDVGSDRNNGPNGYVYIRWTIKNLAGGVLFDSVRIDKHTSGDGAGGIGQWSQAYVISDLVGSSSENVHVTVTKRFISGDYRGHIDGGRHQVRRINGIESEVGY
ncbi:MAG: hypothetical protein ACRCX2_28440 [Paraclostridium sp.]